MKIKVDKRIQKILCFVQGCKCLCDIGCDHGKVCVSSVLQKKAQRAIAADISDLSLNKARKLAKKHEVLDRLCFRCGDGLKILDKGEADVIVVAGVGGELLFKILDQGKDILTQTTKLILSPNNRQEIVRKWLVKHGFDIMDETVVKQSNRFYQVMVASMGNTNDYTPLELELGKLNIQQREKEFIEYVSYIVLKTKKILDNVKKNSYDSEQVKHFENKLIEYMEILK